ncbi:hypothetical protein NQ317_018962, partial [Molorchus minor]
DESNTSTTSEIIVMDCENTESGDIDELSVKDKKPYQCPMGDLPPESNVGCDYIGPFLIKDRKSRKPSLSKAWICIFVCMVTKAIHLELVTDLSTANFIACFKRFIARRGKPLLRPHMHLCSKFKFLLVDTLSPKFVLATLTDNLET